MNYELALHKSDTPTHVIIARHAALANSFLGRFLGLMFCTSFGNRDALVLTPCGSIHTFFMRITIDVVCTDPAGIVVDCAETVQPWRMFAPRRRAQTTMELPPGTIRRHSIAIGDRIQMQLET